MNEQNLADCQYLIRQLEFIAKHCDPGTIVEDCCRRATDAAERIEERLEIAAGSLSSLADVPAINVVRCGELVNGVTGEQR